MFPDRSFNSTAASDDGFDSRMSLESELQQRLADIRDQGLYRELRRVNSPQLPHIDVDGRTLLNFSSNDYLGLANDPRLKEAAIDAVQRYGAGSGASRLICGSLAPHHELEQALAAFKGTEAALTFSSGYATALGVICALLDKDDVIVLDKLVHACCVDAARLSGAKLRIFEHNDLNDLESILKWASTRARAATGKRPTVLVVTESVFSMDGDTAPLRELIELKDRHGAWLMLDEAHATGVFGKKRRGLAEELGVADRVDIQMGTLGKAVGASGGYIAGSRALVDYLINRARSFIFSTAPVPAAAAAARAGIEVINSAAGQERCERLWRRVAQIPSALTGRKSGPATPIIPWIIGDEGRAMAVAAALREKAIFVPAIRYPTVPRGSARLRLTVTAAHSVTDIEQLLAAMKAVDPGLPL